MAVVVGVWSFDTLAKWRKCRSAAITFADGRLFGWRHGCTTSPSPACPILAASRLLEVRDMHRGAYHLKTGVHKRRKQPRVPYKGFESPTHEWAGSSSSHDAVGHLSHSLEQARHGWTLFSIFDLYLGLRQLSSSSLIICFDEFS